jgi:hypothetical protein
VNSPEIELFLARLYTDKILLERFISNPVGEMQKQRVSEKSIVDLSSVDMQGLIMAANSYKHKRQQYQKGAPKLLAFVKQKLARFWKL